MKLVVATISNRNPDPEADSSISALKAPVIRKRGCSDVSLARNLVLTQLCQLQALNQWDCALLADDDMVFKREDVVALVTHAHRNQRGASAAYVLADGKLAAAPWNGRWLTGLGLIAIPMPLLMGIYESAPAFAIGQHRQEARAFCESKVVDGFWRGDDYHLCMLLGGVDLLPVRVGHIKTRALYPAEGGLEEFIRVAQETGEPPKRG